MSDDEEQYSDNESEQSEEEIYKEDLPKTLTKNINDAEIDDAESSDDDDEISIDNEPTNVNFDYQEDDDDDIIESDVDDESVIEEDEEYKNNNIEETKNKKVSTTKKPKKQLIILDEEDEDEDDEEEFNENYLEKFDNELVKNYIAEFHPECHNHNYDEISKMSIVIRNSDGIIIDPLHKTIPYLTKYEKTRVLGQRAKQIETGSKPFVKVPENIIESHIIAELELKEKKIPFIIKRPIPGGGFEYWKLNDLEVIAF
jgi:DNA-directed RNA polymerase I, II, and III subunit RPABC2